MLSFFYGKLLKMYFQIKNHIALILVLIITFFLYLKGLQGDFVFDDTSNILLNEKIRITNLVLEDIKNAFYSGDAGPLGRPVSMITFGLNYYLAGYNPYYFKLTNLIIHLLNGVLVYFITIKIIEKLVPDVKNIYFLSLTVCFIWLVHPINLTSVLYVVQRMTSLSVFFGFMSILMYLNFREGNLKKLNKILCLFILIINLSLSIYSKESGILFVGLIFWIEFILYQGKNKNGACIVLFKIKLINFLKILLVLILALIVYIGIQSIIHGNNLTNRQFTIEERLLTEARVIWLYIKLFFIPQYSDFSLYHDDFLISKSILNPFSTILSVLSLMLITLLSIIYRKKYPVLIFSWGWYVISQLLESTFFALELVHEHRNYFGSFGFSIFLVLFLYDLIGRKNIKIFSTILLIYILSISSILSLRVESWSNIYLLSENEVLNHPNSDRSNFQLAKFYIDKISKNKKMEENNFYKEKALYFLEKSRRSYNPENGGWFAEISLRSYFNERIDEKLLDELNFNLRNKPYYNSNLSFINSLVNCQMFLGCNIDHYIIIDILGNSLKNKYIDGYTKAEIYKLMAQYYVFFGKDYVKGEEFIEESILLKGDIHSYLIAAQIFRLNGKYNDALRFLLIAKDKDIKNNWKSEIAYEEKNLHRSMRGNQ